GSSAPKKRQICDRGFPGAAVFTRMVTWNAFVSLSAACACPVDAQSKVAAVRMVWTDGGSPFVLHDAVILKSYLHLMTRKENDFRLTCGGQDDAKLALSRFHLRTSIGLK